MFLFPLRGIGPIISGRLDRLLLPENIKRSNQLTSSCGPMDYQSSPRERRAVTDKRCLFKILLETISYIVFLTNFNKTGLGSERNNYLCITLVYNEDPEFKHDKDVDQFLIQHT